MLGGAIKAYAHRLHPGSPQRLARALARRARRRRFRADAAAPIVLGAPCPAGTRGPLLRGRRLELPGDKAVGGELGSDREEDPATEWAPHGARERAQAPGAQRCAQQMMQPPVAAALGPAAFEGVREAEKPTAPRTGASPWVIRAERPVVSPDTIVRGQGSPCRGRKRRQSRRRRTRPPRRRRQAAPDRAPGMAMSTQAARVSPSPRRRLQETFAGVTRNVPG